MTPIEFIITKFVPEIKHSINNVAFATRIQPSAAKRLQKEGKAILENAKKEVEQIIIG